MINEGKWEASRSWKSGGNTFSSREFQKGRHAANTFILSREIQVRLPVHRTIIQCIWVALSH